LQSHIRMELSNVLYYSLYENSIYIYIIRQECGKYFIGKTNTPSITIPEIITLSKEHKQQWLLQYRPSQITEIIHSLDPWDEDKITLKYMDKYGIDNVRGGTFNSVVLSANELATIRAMISGAKGVCPICGIIGHAKSNCPMLSEFRDYEVIIKDKDDVIITTDTNQHPENAKTGSIPGGFNLSDTFTTEYFSNTLLSVATATNSLLNSWFRTESPKCLRCGFGGHKTGACQNQLIKCEDSLIFPDNKKYNPIYKSKYSDTFS
jgi:hypothetical protein